MCRSLFLGSILMQIPVAKILRPEVVPLNLRPEAVP